MTRKTSVNLGQTPVEYRSLAMNSYTSIPKDFVRARPLKARTDLLKSNYSLGEEKVDYQTAAMGQFQDPY